MTTQMIDIDRSPLFARNILKLADSNKNGKIDSEAELNKSRKLGTKLLPPKKALEFIIYLETSGQYEVRSKIFHWNNGERNIPVIAWYPETCGTKKLPLITFSHGIGMCGTQSKFLSEYWASKGYVVIAPDHKDSAMCSIDNGMVYSDKQIIRAFLKGRFDLGTTIKALFPDQVAMLDDLSYRPKEISFIIDRALADDFLGRMIDPDSIAVSGHSLGGWTAEAVSGATMNCTPASICDSEKCMREDTEISTENFHQRSCCNDMCGTRTSFKDPRIDAMLALGPGSFLFPNDSSFGNIDVPTMIISGSMSFEVDWQTNAADVYGHINAPKYLLKFHGVDHMTVTDIIADIPLAKLMPGQWFAHAKKEMYLGWSTAFFNAHLKGERAKLDTLLNSSHCGAEVQFAE